jgi:TolA-binding protein
MTPLESFGKQVASALRPGPGAERRLRQRSALLALDWQRRRGLQKARWFVAATAAATVLVLILISLKSIGTRAEPAREALVMAGDPALRGGQWLRASDDQPTRLRFADGTELVLQRESTGRLAKGSESQARLMLEKGSLRARVTSTAITGRTWTFEAGLYEVIVVGTELDVSWNSDSGRLFVRVEHGRVRVRGGQLDADGLLLGDGDELEVEPGRVELRRARGSAAGGTAAPAPAPSVAASADTPARDTATRSSSPAQLPAASAKQGDQNAEKADDWKSLARSGSYEEALQAADGQGFDALLVRLNAADLALLADAARLSGDSTRARSALLTLRRRFGSTDAASLAAFRLGRLAHGAGDYPEAARWFRAYLGETRSGSLADEAMGRLVEAQARAGDRAAAEASAREYLRRFPGGPYESLARGLLKGDRLAPRK